MDGDQAAGGGKSRPVSTLRRRLAGLTRGRHRGSDDETCGHPEHRCDRVTLMLLMPPEKAVALLSEIDRLKAGGNIGALWLNIMHVAVAVTTGAMPDGMEPTYVSSPGRPAGTWWPVNVALLALNAGVTAFFAAMLPHAWLVGAYAAAIAFFFARSLHWRWRRRPTGKGDA